MRSRLDEQLAALNKELIQMASMCEEAIASAAKALIDGDVSLARKVPPVNNEIRRIERTVEAMCLKLLLQQQPVARDLRQISAALKMITDIQRISDQAADIAEMIGYLGGRTIADCDSIREMARAAIQMVTESVDAYVKQDTALAESVIAYDDVVDAYFDKVKHALIHLIAEQPNDGEYMIDLLMVAKYFERIGDHAVNIAEWVVFAVTGVHQEAERK